MHKLDVIVPVKNEAENVSQLVSRIDSALSSHSIKYQLIIVNDHSTDSTASILELLTRKYPITIVNNLGKPGKAYSILEGAKFATAEFVAMIDGDLQYPPEALPEMLSLADKHGIVVANRVTQHKNFLRRFVSFANHQLFGRLILGMNCDIQSGLKVFRRHILDHLPLSRVQAWSLDVPLLDTALGLGYTIGTVPIQFANRQAGRSKISLISASWQIGLSALTARFTRSRIFLLPPTGNSMQGCGIVHKRHTYITHTQLHPSLSAIKTLNTWQKIFMATLIAAIAYGFWKSPQATAIVFTASLSVIYFLDVLFNLFLVLKSLHFPPELTFSSPEVSNLKDADLPVYSILCPLYKEAAVLPDFINSIAALDWPKDKLEVLLLLEEDDQSTIQTAADLNLPSYIKSVIVPHSFPKTKPKACNYGLSHVTGEYVVIYDAEDRPDPQQLKKAYLGFRKSPPKVVCLQAKLNYYNPHHNLITRLFTAEYSLWFDMVLPGLQSINTTIPLGGTSNHFKTQILHELKGWDAFNVTEDCDLGARLFKSGYRTAIIDSVTLEEANSKLGNWMRQRSRWIKGYIQTFLVHNRHPLQFVRQHGWHALIFQLVVGGKIAFMIINPLLWLTTISYFVLYRYVGPTIESLYPTAVFYLAVFSLIFGNFLFAYYYMIGTVKRGHWELVKYVYLIPFYWLMVSIAAAKAFVQLIFKPHYWEKTVHGLHLNSSAVVVNVNPSNLNLNIFDNRLISKLRTLPIKSHTSAISLVVSSVMVNFFNFAYNAYLGRSVSAAEFGLVSLIGSFVYLIGVPYGSVSETLTYRSAYLKGKLGNVAAKLRQYFYGRSLILGSILIVIWLIAIPSLSSFFNASNSIAFLSFAPILVISLLVSVDGGILGGNLRFGILALAAFSEALAKFLIAYTFVSLGLHEYVYLSIPISMLIPLTVYGLVSRKNKPLVVLEKSDERVIKYFPKDFFLTSILTGLYGASFFTIDIVLAKRFLTPADAGVYALIALVGKTVYFIGRLLSQFITPIVSHADGKGSDTRKIFRTIIFLSLLFSTGGFVVFGLLSPFTTPLIFGDKIIPALPYLAIYCAGMVLFTTSTLIVNYHQAKRHFEFPISSIFITLLQVIILSVFHSSLQTFVWTMASIASLNFFIVLTMHVFYPQIRIIASNIIDFFGLFAIWKNGKKLLPDGNLRILIFNWRDIRHKWAGGAEVYIHEIAKRWVSQGHKVTIFCGNDGRSSRNEIIEGVKIIRRGGLFTVYIWAIIYYIAKLIHRFDVIIDSENGLPFFTPLFIRTPKFLLIHHVHQDRIIFQGRLPRFLTSLAMFMESKLMPLVYRNCNVITVSESSRNDIVRLLNIPRERISVVNPGIDHTQFHLSEKTSYPSFLYLGRIRPYKNIDVAIKAFSKVVSKHPTARLTIAGWGENIPELKHLARRLKLSKSVIFLDRVSESQKTELLSQSWVALQPSSFEGWGITVIEANASGTPVIASNTIGLRDSVVDNQTGVLVPTRNAAKFSEAMNLMISDTTSLKRMSKTALNWSKNFNWDIKANNFLEIIKSQMNKPSGFNVFTNYLFNINKN